MAIIKESVNAVTYFKKRLTHSTIRCARCISGKQAIYIVRSEIIHLRVCEECAEEARRLGLIVEPLNSNKHAA
jgi:hypothetical protein